MHVVFRNEYLQHFKPKNLTEIKKKFLIVHSINEIFISPMYDCHHIIYMDLVYNNVILITLFSPHFISVKY